MLNVLFIYSVYYAYIKTTTYIYHIIFINVFIWRHIQLSNVAEITIVERAVAFDKGVVSLMIIEISRVVYGIPTAWFPTYIP